MLIEKIVKLDLRKFDFLFKSLDPLPKDYWRNINRYHGETIFEYPERRNFWNDSLIGLSFECEQCEKMKLAKDEKEFFLESLRRSALEEEQKIKEWNEEIDKIPKEEYDDKETHFLTLAFTRSPALEEAMETNEPAKPYETRVGKRCPACHAPHVWKISVGNDVKVLTRREIKVREVCPRCGKEGSKYVDKRGYVYFQHYEEGKKTSCYVGKV